MSEIRVKSTGTIKLFESDNTSSVTIASPSSLSANRTITIPDADVTLGAGVSLTGSTNNQVTTVTGANALVGETNLIYDGTRLGVGATGASADLGTGIHIKTSDNGGGSVNASADELVIESNGNAGMTIGSGSSSTGTIAFGDQAKNDIGIIEYHHNTNLMSFRTNDADAIIIDTAGNVTKPLQPVFLVRPSSDQASLPASSTTVAWGAEIFDVGSNFASNTFTAPVTGKYQFNVSLYLSNIDIDTTLFDVVMISSNRDQRLMAMNMAKDFSADSNNFQSMNASTILDMDASDTIFVRINITGGGGVIRLDGQAPSSAFYTAWSGALIC